MCDILEDLLSVGKFKWLMALLFGWICTEEDIFDKSQGREVRKHQPVWCFVDPVSKIEFFML